MKAIQGFERLMVSLMMLAVILVCGNLYFTMDRRQAQFETKVTGSLNGLSSSVTTATNTKMDALTTEVHGQLEPVSKQTAALLKALTGKVNALDVAGINNTVKSAKNATDLVTAAVGNVNKAALQINNALPDFLDCQIPTEEEALAGWKPGNPGCLYFRFEEMGLGMKSVSAAMPSIAESIKSSAATVSESLPKIVTNVDGITGDGHAITSDVHAITGEGVKAVKAFTAPPTKKQKLEALAKTGLIVAIKALLF